MNWYLVGSKSHQEAIAVQNLQRLGVEVFCPYVEQSKMIRGKRRMVTGPLFPGYLFARFDLLTQFRKVNYALGVSKVVTFGSFPAIVNEESIESIKSRLHNGCATMEPTLFQAGQNVRIDEEGPFFGIEAVFEKELTNSQRVALLLKTVSYQARVIIDRDKVANL